jgi:RNA polymerase sigma-70 factor (ECF subfamily)
MTDEQLVEQFQGGDDAAFTTLYERYAEPIRRYSELRVGADLADDCCQLVFKNVFEHRAELNPAKAFRPLIYATAHRQAMYMLGR